MPKRYTWIHKKHKERGNSTCESSLKIEMQLFLNLQLQNKGEKCIIKIPAIDSIWNEF